jgi:signal transduction histidine kinase
LLVGAFGSLLLISSLAAWAVWRNAADAQAQALQLRQRELAVQQALESVRSSVFQTAILTRDFLINPRSDRNGGFTRQFQAFEKQADVGFATLDRNAGDSYRLTLRRLREEVNAYWSITRDILMHGGALAGTDAAVLLEKRFQRRQDILALARQIGQLTKQTSLQDLDRIISSGARFRASLGWIAGIALILGICVSAFTLLRIRALEDQSRIAEAELRLLSGQLRTAQEEERRYLSRELHDQVGQLLTGLRMEIAGVARLQDSPESETTIRLGRAKGTVEQTLGIVRNIAMLLRPSMLDDLGLTPAINWLVREFARTSGLTIHASVSGEVDQLPDAHRTCLYRVVQEALTNASRHAGARSIDIAVSCDGNWVCAKIQDDGRGFEVGTRKRKGLGLLGMEERVRELGGSIVLTAALGRGTAVDIRLPRPVVVEELHDQDTDRRRSRHRSDRLAATAGAPPDL